MNKMQIAFAEAQLALKVGLERHSFEFHQAMFNELQAIVRASRAAHGPSSEVAKAITRHKHAMLRIALDHESAVLKLTREMRVAA